MPLNWILCSVHSKIVFKPCKKLGLFQSHFLEWAWCSIFILPWEPVSASMIGYLEQKSTGNKWEKMLCCYKRSVEVMCVFGWRALEMRWSLQQILGRRHKSLYPIAWSIIVKLQMKVVKQFLHRLFLPLTHPRLLLSQQTVLPVKWLLPSFPPPCLTLVFFCSLFFFRSLGTNRKIQTDKILMNHISFIPLIMHC